MIKDFNSFITEDKEYNEIFTLVEEVLSNDYSNREIEESFDEFNLLLESLSDENVKKYLKLYNEFNGNKSKIKDVESQKKDLKKEFNNEIKKLHQSDLPISKIVNATFCKTPSQYCESIPERIKSTDLWNDHSAMI